MSQLRVRHRNRIYQIEVDSERPEECSSECAMLFVARRFARDYCGLFGRDLRFVDDGAQRIMRCQACLSAKAVG